MSEAAGSARHDRFQDYVVPHVEVLYRAALSLTRQKADAEDLVQDTLVRAFNAIERFDGAHPRAWLLTILRNTHLNRARRRTPSLMREGQSAARVMEHLSPSAPASEDVVVDGEFEAVVSEALAALTVQHRAVVALVDIDGLSYRQAADALGVPVGTVMSRLHRARALVRARLDQAGTVPYRKRV